LDIAYIRGHCGALRFVDIIPWWKLYDCD
jgi:hypothetical protein